MAVPDALIYVSFPEELRSLESTATVRSNEVGEYELVVPLRTSFGLVALRDGYQPLHVADIRIPDGEPTGERDLKLVAGAAIEGRVLGTDGQPVAGALVFAEPPGSDPALRSPAAVPGEGRVAVYRATSRSGADGSFRIGGLSTGTRYNVQVRMYGRMPAWKQVDGVVVAAPQTGVTLAMETTFLCRLEFAVEGTDSVIPGVELETLGAASLLPSLLTSDWMNAQTSAKAMRTVGRVDLFARFKEGESTPHELRKTRVIARAPGFEDRSFTIEFVPAAEAPPVRRIELRATETSFGRIDLSVHREGADAGPYTGPLSIAVRSADGSVKALSWLIVRKGKCDPLAAFPAGPVRIEPLDGDMARHMDGTFEPTDETVLADDRIAVRLVLRDRPDRARLVVEVVDEHDRPFAGATVMVQGLRPAGGSYTLFRREASKDFSAVHRHVFSLEAGRCLINASRMGFQRASATKQLAAGAPTVVRVKLIREESK